MSRWRSIKTVPVGEDVDVWATRQALPNGERRVDERRWPDVRLIRRQISGSDRFIEHWQGLPDGWVPSHWRAVPKGP